VRVERTGDDDNAEGASAGIVLKVGVLLVWYLVSFKKIENSKFKFSKGF